MADMANQAPTVNSKAEKWTNQQIELLIDAYKEETFLYATTHVNYHNKHLRLEAISRVCEQLKKLRPTASPKKCVDKLQNLRNKFNIEHSKVKASYESGTGIDNIYQPTLWYYRKLLFLEKYLKPRKNRKSSLENKDVDTDSQQDTAQINIKAEIEVQDDSAELNTAPLTYLCSNSPSISSNYDVQQPQPSFKPSGPVSPASSIFPSPMTSGVSRRPSKKRKRTSFNDGYANAIHQLGELMKQAVTINTIQNTESIPKSSVDPVDSFVNFAGSLLGSFQDEDLKLELMNNITQTLINAKSIDLKRAKKQKLVC